jgi:hypothetical protein
MGVCGDSAVFTVSDSQSVMKTGPEPPSTMIREVDPYRDIAFIVFLVFIGNPCIQTSLSLSSLFRL